MGVGTPASLVFFAGGQKIALAGEDQGAFVIDRKTLKLSRLSNDWEKYGHLLYIKEHDCILSAANNEVIILPLESSKAKEQSEIALAESGVIHRLTQLTPDTIAAESDDSISIINLTDSSVKTIKIPLDADTEKVIAYRILPGNRFACCTQSEDDTHPITIYDLESKKALGRISTINAPFRHMTTIDENTVAIADNNDLKIKIFDISLCSK